MRYITPAQHHGERVPTHPSQRQIHIEPISAPLYIVTCLYNPLRYHSRQKHWWGFEKHCLDSGAIPITVELALRDSHHEVTNHSNPNHIQLRVRSQGHPVWVKENLENVALPHVFRLYPDAEYIGFVDADFLFTRSDWVNETKHMLQRHPVVQMFSSISYETHDHRVHNRLKGFAYMHCHQQQIPREYGHQGAVGGAWAFRRSALAVLGTPFSGAPLLDKCILGSGDYHMAFGLAAREDNHPEVKFKECPDYVRAIREWQEQAAVLKGDIGYVDAHAIHYWHGPLSKRGYLTRPQILIGNLYSPAGDVRYDELGVLQLTGNKPKFRDEIRAYFLSRDEDQLAIDVDV